MFAQTGLGFVGVGSNIVGNINGQGKALGNIIDWNPNQNLLFSSTAKVDISRCELEDSNKFGDYINQAANVPLSNNSIIDTNIDMYKNYRYKARFDYDTTDINGNPAIVEKIIFINSFSERVNNCQAVYNYSTNTININWEHVKAVNNGNILNNSTLTYNIWVCFKSNNNNLFRFDTSNTNTTSFTITHNVTNGINETGTSAPFTIQKGLYFIYVTPKFVTTISESLGISYTKIIDVDYFKNNGIVTRPPDGRILIDPNAPENFKITSPYDGKMTFSWDKPVIVDNNNPTQYRLVLTNTSANIITNFTISQNVNTYTLDNTDLSKANALRPGNYNVSLCAIYYSLESNVTNNLNFTIPITTIDFSQKLVDLEGNITKNIKNGVSGIIFNWKTFSYATYYKIVISQYNENNIQQNTETYHIQHPTNELSLKWNFPDQKSQFKTIISYTTDSNFTPVANTNALGQSYLGVAGQTYQKNFTPHHV